MVHFRFDWEEGNGSLGVSRAAPFCELLEQHKARTVRGLKLEQMVIDKFSSFVAHGHLQHAEAKWRGYHAL